ncbi:MAG: CHAD domain-containing protein, partial [Candidatus Latescibacterota bacterium]
RDTRALVDSYLDTPDWKVFRCGYALRIRTVGKRTEATLKERRRRQQDPAEGREKGPVVRREITQPVPEPESPGSPSGPASRSACAALFSAPGPVTDRLRRILHPEELQVLAAIRTTRETIPLLREGRVQGELTLDRSALAPDDAQSGIQPCLLRVEIESAAEESGSLSAFVGRLRAFAGTAEAAESKFEWALRTLGLTPSWVQDLGRTEPDPSMTVGEVAYAVLRKHFASFLKHEPGTRMGEDPEHLHDMRVATRRMRAALRLFEAALPLQEALRLRRELRTVGRLLGRVRDLDVQMALIEERKAELVTVGPEAVAPLLRLLQARREQARRKLLRFLDSRRFARLQASLSRRLRGGPSARRPAALLPIRAAGPILIRRAHRRLLRVARGIEPSSPPAAYHQMRIRAKRLRYALEFLEPAYGPPARMLIDALTAVQDILGRHQDDQVSMALLRELAEQTTLPGPARLATGEMAQMSAARAEKLRGDFPPAWRSLDGKLWSRWEHTARESVGELGAEMIHNAKERLRRPPEARKGPETSA